MSGKEWTKHNFRGTTDISVVSLFKAVYSGFMHSKAQTPKVLMSIRHLLLFTAVLLVFFSGCGKNEDSPLTTNLTGRAILPADTFLPGPMVGRVLAPEINGRSLPFSGVPVQGFSSIIPLHQDQYLVLQDNGFGTLANSPDVPLQWFHLRLSLSDKPGTTGSVQVEKVTFITDPELHLIETPVGGRLTGAHLDPESFIRLADGSFWIGDEFGPALIHVDSLGHVLEPAVDIPVVPELQPYGRNSRILMTPDHPSLRHQAEAEDLANLPRSGGIEGLALTPNGQFVYASVEKALVEDPSRTRRVILQFDPSTGTFTGKHKLYQVDSPDVSIASLEAVSNTVLLVLERDPGEGEAAVIKRIYKVDLSHEVLTKVLVCDLMDIRDDSGFTTAENGAVGLGPNYSFPYVTPECLAVLDMNTLLVVNDNNYPMSSGRRPPGTPDDNEFIRLHLEHSLLP